MSFVKELEKQANVKMTENFAVGFATTNSKLLDLNFAVSSLRAMPDHGVVIKFKQAYFEDKELGLKWLFYARDIRGGLGERRLFRIAIREIEKDLDERVIDWIVTYGRFDDLFCLIDTRFKGKILSFIKKQLSDDLVAINNNQPVSLLAKWMPSENTSSRKTKLLAKTVRSGLNMDSTSYRKTLSALRKYIDVTEIKMSKQNWSEIDYEKVPSRANLIYKDAFLRHDKERRNEYLTKLKNGEVKINASTLFPHDILHKYRGKTTIDEAIEALWKGLPDYVNNESSTIVVCDGSASMLAELTKTKVSFLEIAGALAIYFSERSKGQFKDKFITFSSHPQFVDLSGLDSLMLKWHKLKTHNEVDSTDIEKVFDLLLKTAYLGCIPQEEIPNVLIISDMEFNHATELKTDESEKLMETIAKKWHDAGYKLPSLSYWNICSRTITIPQIENEQGLKLVSGFAPSVIKTVLSQNVDPTEALKEILLSKRYEKVTFKK